MAEPQIWLDFEFFFSSGEQRSIQALLGRDEFVVDDARIKLTVKHSPELTTEHNIDRTKLNSWDVTQRVVTQELTLEQLIDQNRQHGDSILELS